MIRSLVSNVIVKKPRIFIMSVKMKTRFVFHLQYLHLVLPIVIFFYFLIETQKISSDSSNLNSRINEIINAALVRK